MVRSAKSIDYIVDGVDDDMEAAQQLVVHDGCIVKRQMQAEDR
jgi:hypothetical protein